MARLVAWWRRFKVALIPPWTLSHVCPDYSWWETCWSERFLRSSRSGKVVLHKFFISVWYRLRLYRMLINLGWLVYYWGIHTQFVQQVGLQVGKRGFMLQISNYFIGFLGQPKRKLAVYGVWSFIAYSLQYILGIQRWWVYKSLWMQGWLSPIWATFLMIWPWH